MHDPYAFLALSQRLDATNAFLRGQRDSRSFAGAHAPNGMAPTRSRAAEFRRRLSPLQAMPSGTPNRTTPVPSPRLPSSNTNVNALRHVGDAGRRRPSVDGGDGAAAAPRKRKRDIATGPSNAVARAEQPKGASSEGAGAPPQKKNRKKKKRSYKAMLKAMKAPRRTEEQKQADALAKIKSSLGGGVFAKMERL